MRSIGCVIICILFFQNIKAQNDRVNISLPDTTKKIEIVEVSCGQCQFHLPGKGCNLAVRINKKAYFVDGTNIDDHGDAHAKEGFCNAIRKAAVQGKIVNHRYKVTYFKLIE
ncbi:hypothetical protein LK994_04415 [Ferruginibacter lapsinanis]|uniref:DUF6370 family protein n=1 Tax=Ferruginibacter lapsinanis TaxID=563172 RepID=UPI001E397E7F|nr:DUF6370 family protein [Ferruginibacter lapsinanis]UEG50716.1 hypothetical protein LK994_04415 [Ferruginibacter lapsinanis]